MHVVLSIDHEVARALLDLLPQLGQALGGEEAPLPLVSDHSLQRALRQRDPLLKGHGHNDTLVRHGGVQVREVLRGFLVERCEEGGAVLLHDRVQVAERPQGPDEGVRAHRQQLARRRRVQVAAVQPIDPERHLADPSALAHVDGLPWAQVLPLALAGEHGWNVLQRATHNVVGTVGEGQGLKNAAPGLAGLVLQRLEADVLDQAAVHRVECAERVVCQEARAVDGVPEL
mmetsp:Transcript_33112/g.102821  ORF Transcript_33112/g.102821 Transcript_33112/m.102821 type:complete len:230 (-) Transcript_33112:212-901(-)